MARWRVSISGKAIRKATVERLADQMKEKFGEGASISVHDDTPPESRAYRLSAALQLVSDAKDEVECLKDECQEWYDNLPEAFQNGEKGEALQSAIDALEQIGSDLDNLEGRDGDVEFPGMY